MQRLLAGVAWIGISGLIGRASAFAASVFLAQRLGPSDFGVFSFGLSLAAIFSVCAGFGLDEVLVREIARHPKRSGPLFADTLILRLAAVPLGLVGAVALVNLGGLNAELALCLLAYAVLNSYLLSACAAFRGQGRLRTQALLMGTQVVLIAIAAVTAAWFTARLEVIAVGYVVTTGCVTLTAFILVKGARPRFGWRPTQWVRLAHTSAPFAVGLIGLLAFDRLALVSLTVVGGAEAAGWFAAVQTIVLALAGLATTASMVAFPVLARAAVRDPHQAAELVADLVRVAVAGGLLLSVCLYVIAPWLVPTLFGTTYSQSIAILQLISFSIPSIFVTLVLIAACEAGDRQTTSARSIAAILPVGAMVCFGATWAWGYAGAAAAYSASYFALAAVLGAHWFLARSAVRRTLFSES